MSIWAWSCWGCFLITYFCDLKKHHIFLHVIWKGGRKIFDLSLVLGHRLVKVRFYRWYNICFFKYVKQRNFNLYKFQHCEGLQLCWRQLVAEGWQVTSLSLLDMDGEILRREFHVLIGMEKFWWQLKGRRFVLQM